MLNGLIRPMVRGMVHGVVICFNSVMSILTTEDGDTLMTEDGQEIGI